jgi:exopolysaccharide biosynthesis polyprenyl glycosylphosphotransferase
VNNQNPLRLLQRSVDFATVLVGFLFGYWFYLSAPGKTVPYSLSQFLTLAAYAGFVFLAMLHIFRLYQREASLLNVVETKRLFLACALASLLTLGSTFYVRALDLSRVMLTASLVASFMLLVIQRSFTHRLRLMLLVSGHPGRRALIYGAGVIGKHLFKRIYQSPALGISIEGFLDDDSSLWGKQIQIREIRTKNGTQVLGGVEKLSELKQIHEVYVAMPAASYQRNLEIVQACRKLGLTVSVVPPTYGHHMHNIEIRDIGGIPILREKAMAPSFIYPILKRVFDILISFIALLILSPVVAVISLLIKFDSPGPVIFKQLRIGRDGREFNFYKFRSMHLSANPYGVTPNDPTDPRITRFGRWLRRSSLDELPQFFNVLMGDMSIVGPRPEMPFIVATYTEEQKERLKVKPGITGVWQISAVRGEAIHQNMEYDLFYIEHQSLLLDVIIMIKTIGCAIRGIGAV